MEKMIGNYQVEHELGSGGFGRVYKGYHSILTERTVAVKVLHSHLSSSEEHEQFLQEARFLERLKHPNILHIFDVGVDHEGFPYLVSVYAPGGSLRELLNQHKPRPLPEHLAVSIIAQIGEALQYAHRQQVIHRDLKPENILFDHEGRAFLADFGVAITLTTASVKAVSITGTPPYMAPEQFQGTICKESDQYGLGCIAYELVTGRQPFAAPDFFAMGFQHLSAPPIPPTQFNPELSLPVEQAILKAMHKQRADRHATIQDFITALNYATIAQGSGLLATHVGTAQAEPAPTFPPTQIHAFHTNSENDILTLPSSDHAAIRAQGPITPLPFFPNSSGASTPLQQQGPTTPFPTAQTGSFGTQILGSEASSHVFTPSLPTQNRENTIGGGRSIFTANAFPFADRPFEVPITPPQTLQKQSPRRKPLVTIISFALVTSLVGVLLFVALSYAAGNKQPGAKDVILVPANTATAVSINKTHTTSFHSVPGVKGTATTLAVNPIVTGTSGAQTTPPIGTTATQGGTVPTSNPTTNPNPTSTTGTNPTPTDTPTPTATNTPTPTPTPVTETVTANFKGGYTAVQTTNSYSGTVTIAVSGVGQAYNVSCYSDAFYVYTDQQGNAVTPFHRTSTPNWVMMINDKHTDAFVSLPTYNANHTYTFTITAPGGPLSFGVDDNVTSDDSGAYTVTVTQN
ncbi:MAG: hypothetical protein NVS4B11_12920 [Ktedonobacteraceae bacterium]